MQRKEKAWARKKAAIEAESERQRLLNRRRFIINFSFASILIYIYHIAFIYVIICYIFFIFCCIFRVLVH